MPSSLPHALLVEDEVLLLDSLVLALKRTGSMHISRASNAEEALELIEKDPPDLLVTDVKMPGMGGLELLARVRQGHPRLPVVVISAYGTSIRKQALQKGASAFLEKPFQVSELRALLQSLLIKRGSLLPTRGDADFEGRLESLGIQDVIQVTCLTRKDARIDVIHGDDRGHLLVEGNNVVHAIWREFEGMDAVREMLELSKGRFRVLDATPAEYQTIKLPWAELLMECVRLQDEGAPLPSAPARSSRPPGVSTLASLHEATASSPSLDPTEPPLSLPGVQDTTAEVRGGPPAVVPGPGGVVRGDVCKWLEEVSKVSGRFLGKSVVVNYWRESQPDLLSGFRVQRGGVFDVDEREREMSGSEVVELQMWVEKFVQRGERIVIDLQEEIARSLREDAQAMLGLADRIGKDRGRT